MKRPPTIYITPIHQYAAETQRTLQYAIICMGAILLAAGTAYQAVQIDHRAAVAARV